MAGRPPGPERVAFPLRIEPAILNMIRHTASGELRSSVRPGLTGWAQISGGIQLSNDDKLALDLWYIENRSFILDLKIICLTPYFLIFGDRQNEKRLIAARQRRCDLQGAEYLARTANRAD